MATWWCLMAVFNLCAEEVGSCAAQIITPLIGRHNVYNILAAVAVGLAVTVNGEPIPLKVCSLQYTRLGALCCLCPVSKSACMAACHLLAGSVLEGDGSMPGRCCASSCAQLTGSSVS
jgi:hypothetical protein